MSVGKHRSQPELNTAFWLVMGFVALYLIIAPYFKGVFNGYSFLFEGPLYGSIISGSIIFGVIVIYLFRNWEIASHRDLLAIFVWLIPFAYWMASFGAASAHLATNEVMVKVLWAIFFMIGAFFADTERKSFVLQTIFVISGYLLVLFGFLNWFGQFNFEDAVLNGRLSNVLQYPNVYAAVLIGLIFANIVYVHQVGNRYAKMAVNAMLVPLVLSFMLTLSRGALLVLPVVMLVFLLMLNWRDQLSSLLHLAIGGTVSFLLFRPVMDLQANGADGTAVSALAGWGLLAAASVAVAVLLFLFETFKPAFMREQKTRGLTWTSLIIPLSMAAMFTAAFLLLTKVEGLNRMLPREISSRFQGLSLETASIYDRTAFFKDALRIVRDYPWFGTGGGGWTTLYNTYKSYPYTSTQAHNFYFQHLVETGWIGTIILLAFLLYLCVLFARKWTKSPGLGAYGGRLMYPIFASAILIHSFLDFDMSFVYISTVVMMMLGAMAATLTEPQAFLSTWLNGSKKVRKAVPYSITSLFAIIGLIVLFGSISSLQAHQSYVESRELAVKTGDYQQVKPKLDNALDLKPYHPDYNLFKINIMFQLHNLFKDPAYIQESRDALATLGKKEPYHRLYLEYSIHQAKLDGNHAAARSAYYQLLEAYPWDIQGYEQAVEFFVDAGLNTLDFSDAFFIKQKLEERISKARQIPERLHYKYRNFKITHKLAYYFARAYFAEKDFESATDLLIPHLNTNLKYDYNKKIVRLYIASLQAAGKDDEWWKKRLFDFDPNEEQFVQQLIRQVMQNGDE